MNFQLFPAYVYCHINSLGLIVWSSPSLIMHLTHDLFFFGGAHLADYLSLPLQWCTFCLGTYYPIIGLTLPDIACDKPF